MHCLVVNLALTWLATKDFSSLVENHLILFIDVYCILSECCKVICAETWVEFATLIINLSHLCIFIVQCKNHYTHMVLSCAGLLYDALLVYKAILLIVLTCRPYYHLLTWKFNLTLMSPNLKHLFRFVQYQGHSCQDSQVMSKIQNKMVSRITL